LSVDAVDPVGTTSRPSFRSLPEQTTESDAFWTGGERGELMIDRCRSCGRHFHPPAPACFRCRSTEVGPEPVSGRATIATFTINRHQWFRGFQPPYVVAIVELEEDATVRLTTNIVGCDVDDVFIGQHVAVEFEPWEDVWIPVFRPVAQ
jgi:uncharacterized protein